VSPNCVCPWPSTQRHIGEAASGCKAIAIRTAAPTNDAFATACADTGTTYSAGTKALALIA
jgi:hypothetical protein